jgi:hypothetical protein
MGKWSASERKANLAIGNVQDVCPRHVSDAAIGVSGSHENEMYVNRSLLHGNGAFADVLNHLTFLTRRSSEKTMSEEFAVAAVLVPISEVQGLGDVRSPLPLKVAGGGPPSS